MASFKSLLNCIGVDTSGSVSILKDAFGFRKNRVPADPSSSVTASVSLLEKAQGLKNKHVNLNVIRVGFDALSTSGEDAANDKLDYAILRCHKIFSDENLGIGRVSRFVITEAQADGAGDLGSETEADELSDDWTVDNDGIDPGLFTKGEWNR